MKKFSFIMIFFSLLITPLFAESPQGINEELLLGSLRKALSVRSGIELRLSSFTEAPVPAFFRAQLLASWSGGERREEIYISKDGRYYVVGKMFDAFEDMDQVRMHMMDLSNSPFKGSSTAPVVIVEFADFQCTACKNAYQAMKNDKLFAEYSEKVKFVFKSYPVSSQHKWAEKASIAAFCAQEQGMDNFWQLLESIYENQNDIVLENLRQRVMEYIDKMGIDKKKFETCYDKDLTRNALNRDIADAKKLDIYSTPTFYINGRTVIGNPGTAELKKLINEFLGQSKVDAAP